MVRCAQSYSAWALRCLSLQDRQCEGLQVAGQVTITGPALLCMYLYEGIMANWQDIRALEERIYEQVEEFLNNQEAYVMPVLSVYLDLDDMTYKAAAEDGLQGTEDEGIYPMSELIRMGDNGKPEPDIDKISDVANSWIFLD